MTTATRTLRVAGDGWPVVIILCPHGLTETRIDLAADRMAQRAAIVAIERNHVSYCSYDCIEIVELDRKLPAAVYSAATIPANRGSDTNSGTNRGAQTRTPDPI